ncbi:MAG TPA: C1 family peptidase [Chitinophagaceae bacterium]|nr:C1 family peptidase [Chitinophagaceae bacterium]
MRKLFFFVTVMASFVATAQPPVDNFKEEFTSVKLLPATSVKNQAHTGTCWCFSTTSLVESECMKNVKGELDLSEMFTVRNIYIEKARNYVLRQGKAQFGEGGLGHDMIRAMSLYGAVPDSVYSGLKPGQSMHDHSQMVAQLQQYLNDVLKKRPVAENWLDGYVKILDQNLGPAPTSFKYNGKTYTPQAFAKDVLKFDADNYINVTSFTHHPYYKPFILEAPDNFANGSFYNLPLREMIDVVKDAVNKGYTVMWDADVSNNGFNQRKGLALYINKSEPFASDAKEEPWDATKRQALYENLTTEDDHLMHIVGIEKSKDGKLFFIVKNSWGKEGPYDGYINVSESYFAINTVSLVLPKAALSKELLAKLEIK